MAYPPLHITPLVMCKGGCMKSILVYDWPLRIFHTLFSVCFIIAFAIGKTADDESALFPYHILVGITLVLLVFMRIIWGFAGTRYARFGSFNFCLKALFNYLKQALVGKTERTPGHNPASSWIAVVMLLLVLGIASSGYMMVQNMNKEFYEEVHEILANTLLVAALLHVAGILLHTIKHRDFIGLSMIHGRKQDFENSAGIENARPVAGLLLLVIIAAFAFNLYKNYDPAKRTLNLFGTTLQLGENEEEEHEGSGNGGHEEDHGGD